MALELLDVGDINIESTCKDLYLENFDMYKNVSFELKSTME